MRILIVEDNRHKALDEADAYMFTELLSHFLEIEADTTPLASEINRKITTFRPHAILLDLTLEDSKSHETIDRVIPAIADKAPVLVLTSQTAEEVGHSIERGAIAVFEKIEAVQQPEKFSRAIVSAVAEFAQRQTTTYKVKKAQASLLHCEGILNAQQ